MIDTVRIDRYCAIEDTNCKREIEFKGPLTYFFAYQSENRMQSWTKGLVNDLANRGIRGERWEDLVRSDLIFSKVCEQIHASGFLLAEVTQPNLNVLLEIGYALAVGRQPILLKNKNHKSWTRDLLTTMESCFYATRQDVLEYIAKWQASQSIDYYDPNQRLPFLENMGIFDDQQMPDTVFHLKPKLSTDWISLVDKTFTKSPFKLISMDPSDSVSDEFYPQARLIQRASLIVASLLSKNSLYEIENNANVALLTGFSIGLGKKVLVLQENPSVDILDLGSVSRPFETEDQVQEIVDAWIEKQSQISIQSTIESDRHATSKKKADDLRKVYLGHPDALQDTELHRSFVRTKEFDDAVEGRRTIFVGRRGSGKSANFQEITAEISPRPNIVCVKVQPDDHQLNQITDFLGSMTYLPDARLTFQSIWNYVLTTEMLKALAENTELLYSSRDDTTRNNLLQAYEKDRHVFDVEFGSRTAATLKNVLSSSGSLALEEESVVSEDALKTLRDYALNRHLKNFATSERITFFVVADDLDKHWNTGTQQAIDLLVGLLAEVARMQKFYGECIRIALFLREDIFNTLTRHDDDLQQRDFLRIGWTKANLRHLVAVRLDTEDIRQNDDEVWNAIFPEPVNGIEASQYILTRSLPRPRDVLSFCQQAIDEAQRNGHSHVTTKDILTGEEAYSNNLFHSVSSEFRMQYPELEEVLFEFLEVSERISWDDFERIANEAISRNISRMRRWMGGKIITTHFLTEALFNIGLIGLSRNSTSRIYSCNERAFSEIWRLTSSKPVVHIHPAFHKCLEISEQSSMPTK